MPSGYMDPEDIAQERALAEWLGKDADKAERAYRRRESKFYHIRANNHDSEVALEGWTQSGNDRIKISDVQISLFKQPIRSAASIEQRKEYTKNWWRTHGKEYRASRREKANETKRLYRLRKKLEKQLLEDQ